MQDTAAVMYSSVHYLTPMSLVPADGMLQKKKLVPGLKILRCWKCRRRCFISLKYNMKTNGMNI